MTSYFAVILRKSPYGHVADIEAIRLLAAFTAMGIPMTVVFMNDSVFTLVEGQSAEGINMKSYGELLSTRKKDVEAAGSRMVVHKRALEERGLTPQNLIDLKVGVVDDEGLADLLADHLAVIAM